MQERPSKKQRELLQFIEGFIKGNGYGPSYREIMRALDYKSVSTVAVHVDGLISRGWLRKTDHSARSLEVVGEDAPELAANEHIVWLKSEIEKRKKGDEAAQKDVEVLEKALKVIRDAI